MKLGEIARLIGGDIVSPISGDGIEILGVAAIESAGPGQITFVGAPQYERFLATTRAAAILVPPNLARRQEEGSPEHSAALLRVQDPYRAFVRVMHAFDEPDDDLPPGIHPTAVVPNSASVHPEARVGAYVVLGEEVTIGASTRLWPHVVLGRRVAIGADCVLHPSVTVRERCRIGDRVIIHPGAVIGADGFGFLPTTNGRREKVPQIGRVVIEDDVEIGANTTIDRATLDDTVIRRGAKLDNLVQIAHNVEIGEDSCLAAQVGVSGSTRIGARNLIAGQVGFGGHLETCDDVILIARSGVIRSISRPGIYGGAPAKEREDFFRLEAALRSLPDTVRRLRDLERRLSALDGKAGDGVT